MSGETEQPELNMTHDEMRIAVAEAHGYKQYHEKGGTDRGITDWEGYDPTGKFVIFEDLPDYPNDLNAMHEAEKVLTNDQREDYMNWLGTCDTEWNSIHATAAQRREAFLRTIGKWKQEEE